MDRASTRSQWGVGRAATVLVVAALSLAVPVTPAAAQDPSPQVLPIAPDPARCVVQPRSLADVTTMWQEVNAGPAPSPAEHEGAAILRVPTDEATTAAVRDLLVQVLACGANGGNGLAAAALLTERHLRENLYGLSQEEFAALYTETPTASAPEQWVMLYDVRNPGVLDDGRIATNPELIVPGVGRFVQLVLITQDGGQLRVDLNHDGEGGNLYP